MAYPPSHAPQRTQLQSTYCLRVLTLLAWVGASQSVEYTLSLWLTKCQAPLLVDGFLQFPKTTKQQLCSRGIPDIAPPPPAHKGKDITSVIDYRLKTILSTNSWDTGNICNDMYLKTTWLQGERCHQHISRHAQVRLGAQGIVRGPLFRVKVQTLSMVHSSGLDRGDLCHWDHR